MTTSPDTALVPGEPAAPATSSDPAAEAHVWTEPLAPQDATAPALPAPAAPAEGPEDGQQAEDAVRRDAREFGAFARTGGWTFALKVARSVRPGGVPAQQADGAEPKVSAKEFARLAGCSAERVMRFWRAWDRAADDGVVPVFEALAPGVDVELPDADVWLGYYTSRSSGDSPRGQAISATAEAEGIRPTKALEVAENPTALRAAILADPGTAQAARHALLDRLEDDPELGRDLAKDIARTGELSKAVAAEARVATTVESVRDLVDNGEMTTPSGERVPAPEHVVAEAKQHLALIEGLDEEDEAGYAADAHKAVRSLVAEAVEDDPQLRAHERRTRFQGKVRKAAKAFEELTLDDAADVYEEELLEQLETLQRAVADCIAELRAAAPPDREA
ncbi:hypothetical protein [Streptomyces boncukensis]|uniref:Uncharacterized protein n=1 Tax=Streptomyces boncukensis TaxID=2711219 RepID=A0A6G4WVX5_9ACTN|nr:hypothetical protein [Streptomyces boncukensis]NGO69436.1 hypothetical protein [Streptomyces boncukensis]